MNRQKFLTLTLIFFYLDVMSSFKECEIAIKAIAPLKKDFLVGIHIREGEQLPSGEDFVSVVKKTFKTKSIGCCSCMCIFRTLEASCKKNFKDKNTFGFKINAFQHIPAGWKPDSNNPNVKLGKRKDLTPATFLFNIKKNTQSRGDYIGWML